MKCVNAFTTRRTKLFRSIFDQAGNFDHERGNFHLECFCVCVCVLLLPAEFIRIKALGNCRVGV